MQLQILPADPLKLPHTGVELCLFFEICDILPQLSQGQVLFGDPEDGVFRPLRQDQVRVGHGVGAEVPGLIQQGCFLVVPQERQRGGANCILLRSS